MAQGAIKKKQPSALIKKKSTTTKKTISKITTQSSGKRIAPKDNTIISQKKITKKLRANNIRQLESVMAAQAGATGKLTVMKPIAVEALKKSKEETASKASKKAAKSAPAKTTPSKASGKKSPAKTSGVSKKRM